MGCGALLARKPALDPIGDGHEVACWVDTVTGKRALMNNSNEVLVKIEDLKNVFPDLSGRDRRQVGSVRAVDDVSLEVYKGETLGLVEDRVAEEPL